MTKLYEAKNHILIHAEGAEPTEHRHMAAHIIVSLEGSMKVLRDGAEYLCGGVIIPAGVSHAVKTEGNAVLVFLYDCTTDVARQIKVMHLLSEACCNEISMLYAELERSGNYDRFEKGVLRQVGMTDTGCGIMDERIRSAMQYIRTRLPERISCGEVADGVHLSQGRFSHLFREQVGMTFASYLIYQRIMYVYAEVLRGRTITDAALDAGFSSSSHFADINRRVFGLSASGITRDLIFCKV